MGDLRGVLSFIPQKPDRENSCAETVAVGGVLLASVRSGWRRVSARRVSNLFSACLQYDPENMFPARLCN
jgi:hypothetical protein